MNKLFLLLLAAACVENKPGLEGTQSLEIALISPANPGTVDVRLGDGERTVIVDVTAKDAHNAVDASFSAQVRVYAQFLGTLTPAIDAAPLATITVTNGIATNQTIMLPPSVFGATTLWFDNGTGLGPEYKHGQITGNSPTLWYRDPFIVDLQKPRDEMALDALSVTPLSDKQISVRKSRYGDRGVLVVTSTFAQGYTVSDVQCATGLPNPTPPCIAMDYDHAMVFTFSAPRDSSGAPLVVGRVIEGFAGGLSEFNGLTEVGFPRTFTDEENPEIVNPALLPAAVKMKAMPNVDTTWFAPLTNPDGRINFERNEAGAIEINNAKVCPLDDDYTTYKQWKLDPSVAGDQCDTSNVINLITTGTDFTVDPASLVGMTLPRVVGILRPVNIGSFNVWIVYPRGTSDLTLQ